MKSKHHKKRRQPIDPATVLIIKQGLLGLSIFSILALIITATWYGTRLLAVTIAVVTTEGGETIAEESVHDVVEAELVGTYLGIIPKRFTFFYPEEAIQAKVSQITRIKDVVVERTNKRTLLITYDEYKPDALWCGQTEQNTCYFLDAKGYAFGVAPELLGGSLLRYYSLQAEPTVGTSPFPSADYLVTKEFVQLLSTTGWYIKKVEIDSARDVFYTLNPSSELKASLTKTPEEIFSHLETLRLSKEFAHLAPGSFQYIDLRFGTKIFVNEVLIDPAVSEGASSTTTSTAEGVGENDEVFGEVPLN